MRLRALPASRSSLIRSTTKFDKCTWCASNSYWTTTDQSSAERQHATTARSYTQSTREGLASRISNATYDWNAITSSLDGTAPIFEKILCMYYRYVFLTRVDRLFDGYRRYHFSHPCFEIVVQPGFGSSSSKSSRASSSCSAALCCGGAVDEACHNFVIVCVRARACALQAHACALRARACCMHVEALGAMQGLGFSIWG